MGMDACREWCISGEDRVFKTRAHSPNKQLDEIGEGAGGTNYRIRKEKGTVRIGLSEAMLLVSEWFHRKGKWQDKRRP